MFEKSLRIAGENVGGGLFEHLVLPQGVSPVYHRMTVLIFTFYLGFVRGLLGGDGVAFAAHRVDSVWIAAGSFNFSADMMNVLARLPRDQPGNPGQPRVE